MPATTWRLTGLTLPDGRDLRITGVQLWAGNTDVTAQATVSSSFAPSEGALSALTDGDAGTACLWAAQQVRLPGFYIEWTFAAAVEITRIFLGATAYAGVLTGGASVINAIGAVAGGVMLGAVSWQAKKALEHGAVGFWSLTDSSSVQPDEVAGARNATRTGGAIVAAQLAFDGALAFDPQGAGYIRVPSAVGIDAGAFSLCVDFQITTSLNCLLVEHGTDNAGWSLATITPESSISQGVPIGALSFIVGGAAIGRWFTDVSVVDGASHRLVAIVDSSGLTALYLDGRLATRRGNAAAGVAKPTYNTTYIDIGSRNGAYGLPPGSRIANFALFNRVLSANEALLLSNSVGWPIQTFQQAAALVAAQDHWLAQGESATLSPKVSALDMEHGGNGVIHGTVELYAQAGNIPLARRVRLQRSRDSLLVRETWSNAQGQYRFEGISQRYTYDVIAWDHEGLQRSVVANDLTPEVMP